MGGKSEFDSGQGDGQDEASQSTDAVAGSQVTGAIAHEPSVDLPGCRSLGCAPFPHVPCWQKVGAGALFAVSTAFGVGFMDAGDSTEIRTEKVCPPDAVLAGGSCRIGSTPADEPPTRAEGLAAQVGDVVIQLEGGSPSPGTVGESDAPGRVLFQVPLFRIGEPHRISLLDAEGRVVDEFTLVVPAPSGLTALQPTARGGDAQCLIDHERPILGGASGADCRYQEPAVTDTPPADDGSTDGDQTVPAEIREVEESTDGKPWSLLAIPGAALALYGGLSLAERRRREGGWDPVTGTYPDWHATDVM